MQEHPAGTTIFQLTTKRMSALDSDMFLTSCHLQFGTRSNGGQRTTGYTAAFTSLAAVFLATCAIRSFTYACF
jgi:hypothetical protein